MTIKHFTYLLAFCFTGVALCFVIGVFSRHWPRTHLRSIYTFKQEAFTSFGWKLRNTSVAFAYLACTFGIVSYLS